MPLSPFFSLPHSQVLFERRGSLGIATLNRPRALNALTETMVRRERNKRKGREREERFAFDRQTSKGRKEVEKNSKPLFQPPLFSPSPPTPQVSLLFRQYSQWDEEPSVSAILLRGSGEKAFCAGGDVKAAASAVASGRPEVAFAFFKAEYKLNHLISKLTKPHIALIDGIVMGGGAGLSVHGRFRVATETTTFAMPECAIGLFPDVGTTFFLPRACGLARARWIALTGARLRGREVLESGVGTHFVAKRSLPALVEALSRLRPSPDSNHSPSWIPAWLLHLSFWKRKERRCCPVAAVLSEFEEGKGKESPFSSSSSSSAPREEVERLFGPSCTSLSRLREAVSREAKSTEAPPEWLRDAARALSTECPQSQALSWALLEASTTDENASSKNDENSFSLKDTLRLEWRILNRVSLLRDSDFVEGVDARLLCKPARLPRWRGSGGEQAARGVVAAPLPPSRGGELELEGGNASSSSAPLQSRL